MPNKELEQLIADPDNWMMGEVSPPMKSLWKLGMRQPKQSGALYEVLERAATKSGMGHRLTPGEAKLLKQYTDPILGRAAPNMGMTTAQQGAMNVENTFKPWRGVEQLKKLLGF